MTIAPVRYPAHNSDTFTRFHYCFIHAYNFLITHFNFNIMSNVRLFTFKHVNVYKNDFLTILFSGT